MTSTGNAPFSMIARQASQKLGILDITNEKRKWRPQCQAVKYSLLNFEYFGKSLQNNALRFNPIQIAEWLADLLACGEAKSQAELEDNLGIDRTRIGQFLRLVRLPEGTRTRRRNEECLNECRVRKLVAIETVSS